MTTIPEDVAALIRQAARAEPAGIIDEATRLCTKYDLDAGPETLAECGGAITYERVYWTPERNQIIEADQPRGIRFWLNKHPTPWPDDGGICQLLNDGWRLVPHLALEMGVHEVYNPTQPDTPWRAENLRRPYGQWLAPAHYVLAREVSR